MYNCRCTTHSSKITFTPLKQAYAGYREKYGGSAGNGLTGGEKSGIIKNIEVPTEANSIKGMSKELYGEIQRSIDKITNEYDVKIDSMPVKPLGKEFDRVPFQFQPNSNGGSVTMDIVINADYNFNGDLESFEARIMRNHNSGVLASQSVEDLLWHEAVHVMSFQDCVNYKEVSKRNDEIRPEYKRGISGYSDNAYDGVESMAEGFVKLRHGEKIPESIVDLLNKYVERWKK